MKRLLTLIMLAFVAGVLAGCMPESGTVTDKRSEHTDTWHYYVSVDGVEHEVGGLEYDACDRGEELKHGNCPS